MIIAEDNGKQDMVRVWEDLFYEKRFTATDLPNNPDYGYFANSFGIKAINCYYKEALESTINYAINYNGPIIVNFQTEKDYCLPLVAPGKSLDETFNYQDNNFPQTNEFKNVLPPS